MSTMSKLTSGMGSSYSLACVIAAPWRRRQIEQRGSSGTGCPYSQSQAMQTIRPPRAM